MQMNYKYLDLTVILNLLFLGLGASAICFVTWNIAVKTIGAVKASLYINAVPMVTVILSMIVLHEKLNWMSSLGIALVLCGLLISQFKKRPKIIIYSDLSQK